MECIILAGGLGTRLQGVIGAYPKCMAPVNDKPFLEYIFKYLIGQGCTRVILSLGFKHEIITEWLGEHTWPFEIDYVIEYEPLGTGGGISLAMTKAKEDSVFVLNGDTMFKVDLHKMQSFHDHQNAEITIALKRMQNFDRYGVVITDSKQHIVQFEEKKYMDEGQINGGIYCINRKAFILRERPDKYSFEKDYLEEFVGNKQFYGYSSDTYFIDIGIPDDFKQAQNDFKSQYK